MHRFFFLHMKLKITAFPRESVKTSNKSNRLLRSTPVNILSYFAAQVESRGDIFLSEIFSRKTFGTLKKISLCDGVCGDQRLGRRMRTRCGHTHTHTNRHTH